jgi:hypothetical protein
MKKAATILIIFFSSVICYSQTTLDRLINETQLSSPSSDKVDLVWWIPDEFWIESFKSDPTMTEEQKQEWISMLSDYSIFIVLSGDVGSFGQVSYKSEELIHKNVSLKDRYNKRYYPLSLNEINSETKYLLEICHQVLGSTIGDMGKNMNWVIFTNQNHKEESLLDPYIPGEFIVSLYNEDYKFRCPLGSLIPAKSCPIDNEKLNGAWEYCPWHGKELR